MLYITYNCFSRAGEVLAQAQMPFDHGCRGRPYPTRSRCRSGRTTLRYCPPQRSIRHRTFASPRVARVRISVGKLRGLQQISDDSGRFTMIAMDQRGSLQKMINTEDPKATTHAEMEGVKLGVTDALAPHASGYLLDPEYGVGPAINRFVLPGRTGLLVALEQSGYEKQGNWRLTTLLDGWSVEKVKRLGASAAKLLVFFNPDAPREIVEHQVKIVRSVADECRRLDLAFVCEPMSYAVGESEAEFAHHKADTIVRTAEALSPLGIDVLKAEFPGDPKATPDPGELRKNCERLSRATKVPWVVLSAGADFPVFRGLVDLACQGGASGFLAGRAIWKDAFREKTFERQMEYVRTQAVKNFQVLADLAHKHARPWWDFYGGKEKLLDPLDGSSNVKSNNTFGTIFGVFDGRPLPARGSDLFAAGYLIYGPATTLVYATAKGVHEFVQGGGDRPEEFWLIEEGLRLPAQGKLYGIGGHREKWVPEVKAFAIELERELMNLRYGGSFVADFNQILHYGGFFAYPAQVDKPAGKYRLHFESNPIAFIAEAAGGAGTTGRERLLDVAPKGIDQTVPTYLGNQDLVDRFRARF